MITFGDGEFTVVSKTTGQVFQLRTDGLPYDLTEAKYALQLSRDIYSPQDFDKFNAIVSTEGGKGKERGYHGFVVIENTLYIVHRGCSNERDWSKSLQGFRSLSSSIPGKIHSGFFQEAQTKSWSHINNFLSSGDETIRLAKRVVFCGHSKGGAVAAIQCLMFLLDVDILPQFKEQVKFVGFGTPLFCDPIVEKEVGNCKLHSKFHFFAMKGDPVPLVGALFFNQHKLYDIAKDVIAKAHPLAGKFLEMFTKEICPHFAPIGTWYFNNDIPDQPLSILCDSAAIMTFLKGSLNCELPSADDALKIHYPSDTSPGVKVSTSRVYVLM
jgi:hypothetical protein